MSYAGKVRINNVDSPIASALYGLCTTPGGTAAKVVSLSDFDTLITGVSITVKFSQANTAANPTLNVNGTGDIPIYVYGSTKPGTTAATSWASNSIVTFTYDGTNWCMNDVSSNNSIISLLEGEVTSEATARATAITQVYSRIAPDYDSTATYRKNDLVIYGEQLYRCNNDITVAEAWTAAHWTATTVAAEREYKLVFTDTEIGIASTATADIGASTGITAASVDVSAFEAIISTTGSYVFTYTGTDWTYDSGIVVLSNYGITVTGTPVQNDTVTVAYTAGTAPFKYNVAHEAEGYPYRSIVPLANVKATMIPQVTLGLADAISGMFAPIVESYDGGIFVYATNEPTGSITIPTIICWG